MPNPPKFCRSATEHGGTKAVGKLSLVEADRQTDRKTSSKETTEKSVWLGAVNGK